MQFDAAAILAIPEAQPHVLFTEPAKVEEMFRELARKWHPDRSTDPAATQVFQHIHVLFGEAKKAVAQGTWGHGDVLVITTTKGPTYWPYLKQIPFELGETYVCSHHIIYATRRDQDDLCKRFLATTKEFDFPNETMRKEFDVVLPRGAHTIANHERAYTIIKRPAGFIRLADILAKNGSMEPAHVAWTLSRLYNISCWLDFNAMRHLDISPETVFINPATHQAALLGGWFYSRTHLDMKTLAAPARTAHFAKMEPNEAHLAMIRQTGRKLLGASSAVTLNANPKISGPLKQWLTSPSGSVPVDEYKKWHRTLEDAFGKRRFTVYPLTPEQIYGS